MGSGFGARGDVIRVQCFGSRVAFGVWVRDLDPPGSDLDIFHHETNAAEPVIVRALGLWL